MTADREALKRKAESVLRIRHGEHALANGVLSLLAELEAAEAQANTYGWRLNDAVTVSRRLEDERDQLRETLRFYANPRHWNDDGVCEYADPEWTLGPTQDEGWHARRALGEEVSS